MAVTTTAFSPVNIEERKNIGLRSGDTVRVHQKIEEKGKTRTQVFEGLVLATKHGTEPGATFTVRRVSSGVGVERIFPLYSPNIDKIEIVKRAKTRRSKLYYIREKVAREIRRQMRSARFVDISTESEEEAKSRAEKEAQEAEEKSAQEAAEAPEEEKPSDEQGSEETSESETDQPETEEQDTSEEKSEEGSAEDDDEARQNTEAASKVAAEAMGERRQRSRKSE